MPSTLIVSLFCLSAFWAASPVYSLALHPGGGNMIASRTTSYHVCDNHTVTAVPDCPDERPECVCTIEYIRPVVNGYLCDWPGGGMGPSLVRFVSAQLFLDAHLDSCHSEGYNMEYRLEIPPEAQRNEILRQNANLRLQQKIFLALQIIGGHIGLVVTILFTLSQSAHRDLTFFSFCITWIISSVVYSISLYKETRRCYIQAILVAGSQIMTAGSTMTLVLQLLLNLHSAIYAEPKNALKRRRWVTLMLVALPYGGFAFGSLFPYLSIIKRYPSLNAVAIITNFYCMITDDIIVRTVYITTIIFHVVALIFDVLIGIILYRCWKAFQHKLTNKIPLDTLVRIIFFSIYRMVVIGAFATVAKFSIQWHETFTAGSEGFAITGEAPPKWVDFLQATGPLVAFLVLGVNKDMVKALMFWKRKTGTIQK